MNAWISRQELARIIEDALFLSPKITGHVKALKIPGLRGFISSCSNPDANRVGLAECEAFDECIMRACNVFANQNQGFTWVVGLLDIHNGLPGQLRAHGFTPAHFHQIAGMFLKAPYPVVPTNSAIQIVEIQPSTVPSHITMIAHAFGISEEIAMTKYGILPGAEIRSRCYLAFLQGQDEPIGYCTAAEIPQQPILLLRGAAVLPQYRGQGIYKSMLQRRLADAQADGLGITIVQAARSTSYSSCRRLGFEEICAIEWYQWSPESEA